MGQATCQWGDDRPDGVTSSQLAIWSSEGEITKLHTASASAISTSQILAVDGVTGHNRQVVTSA